MAMRSDSRGLELQYLLDMLSVEGERILEIGCGDGRLTRQYAERAASVVGIDPAHDALLDGQRETSQLPAVTVLRASSIELPFAARCFDHAIFAWSF